MYLKKVFENYDVYFNKLTILAQSKTYVDLAKPKLKIKKYFFSLLARNSGRKYNSDELLQTKIDKSLNIFFTGSVGDAQNYKVLIKIINKQKI